MDVLTRTGVAAILAGALVFAGHVGEVVFGTPTGRVLALFVAFVAGGVVALFLAFLGFRVLLRRSLTGRIATWTGLIGAAFLAAFAVQAAVEVARAGDVPDNFVLFGLGFLLLFVAHVLLGFPLRGLPIGIGWLLSPLAAAGVVVALAFDVDPVHDIGLVVFEAAWVALGVLLLHARSRSVSAHGTV